MYERIALIVEVATLYYKKNMTQAQIAEKVNISRPTVSNLLKEGKELGIINITIQEIGNSNYEDQEYIKNQYNLETVLIANTKSNGKEAVAGLGARYVESRLKDINTLGIGWGTTLNSFVEAANILHHPQLTVIPMIGGVSAPDVSYHSNHLAFKLAKKFDAQSKLFYAPAVAESVQLKKNFEESTIIQESLNSAKKVDLAVLAIGNPRVSDTYKNLGYVNKKKEDEITEAKVIGDILATFFDKNGNEVSTSLSERMIGPTLTDINKMREVVIISAGAEKAEGIEVLLKKGTIDHLIIDKSISEIIVKG